ncbi:MAG: tetratricopeptide repeat protein [Promethearchaeota archaeon]|nr:MAG: tetratricopeptide repeat protein [Candidatus Lokiarchaeota archaeon]
MMNIQDIINKAQKLKSEEKFLEAIKLLEDLPQSELTLEIVRKNLIDILFSYGGYLNDEYILEYEKAIEIFKKIITLEPENYKAHYNLGIAYFNLGRIENALASYNEAIKIKPDYKHCYYNIGLVFESKNDLKQAISYYNKALDIDPKFPYAVHSREFVRKKLDSERMEQPGKDEFNICKTCGNANRLEAKFCDKCGNKL